MIDETAAEIESMHTHSSSEVAIKAAQALQALLDRDYATVMEFHRDLEHNAGVLRRANPSHPTLENTLREIETTVLDADQDTVSDAQDVLAEAISTAVTRIEQAKQGAAQAARELFSDGQTVLTHDFSTTVVEALTAAADDGLTLNVLVTEARPRYLGRKTARTLAKIDGLAVTLIVDSAVGHHLTDVDLVLTGMTAIVDETLYNRVGTYPIATTAADQNVPMAVTGSSHKILASGFVFENDFRSTTEVLREPADGFEISNPAYDATPLRLIDHLVTEDGIDSPPVH